MVQLTIGAVAVVVVATGLQTCLADANSGGLDGVDVKKMERLFVALA